MILSNHCIREKLKTVDKNRRGVSRVHSIPTKGRKKERIQSIKKLHPQYVAGFIDGEGSFSVSIYKDETMHNKIYVRPEFEIELRADDWKILERIQKTLKCGIIYNCNYERYGWYPHVKYKVSRLDELNKKLIPFLEKHPLQAKKMETFRHFKTIVRMVINKKHLRLMEVRKITKLRDKIRALGKKHRLETARVRENRSPSGVGR